MAKFTLTNEALQDAIRENDGPLNIYKHNNFQLGEEREAMHDIDMRERPLLDGEVRHAPRQHPSLLRQPPAETNENVTAAINMVGNLLRSRETLQGTSAIGTIHPEYVRCTKNTEKEFVCTFKRIPINDQNGELNGSIPGPITVKFKRDIGSTGQYHLESIETDNEDLAKILTGMRFNSDDLRKSYMRGYDLSPREYVNIEYNRELISRLHTNCHEYEKYLRMKIMEIVKKDFPNEADTIDNVDLLYSQEGKNKSVALTGYLNQYDALMELKKSLENKNGPDQLETNPQEKLQNFAKAFADHGKKLTDFKDATCYGYLRIFCEGLLTVATGIIVLPIIRAIHSKVTRDTFKYWQSRAVEPIEGIEKVGKLTERPKPANDPNLLQPEEKQRDHVKRKKIP